MAGTANKPTRIEQGCPGVISTHEHYTIAEAKRRLGWSDSAYRAAKRRGLAVLACGKRRYVTGLSILTFLESGVGSTPGG